jgi:hypothetical protein
MPPTPGQGPTTPAHQRQQMAQTMNVSFALIFTYQVLPTVQSKYSVAARWRILFGEVPICNSEYTISGFDSELTFEYCVHWKDENLIFKLKTPHEKACFPYKEG